MSAICVALLLHRSAAVRQQFLNDQAPGEVLEVKPFAVSSGIILVICPKACMYDAWMRGLERFTAVGHKVFLYEGARREERLRHTLESVYRYNLRDLKKRCHRQKNNRLLFIITTSQTASRECMPNRNMYNLKKTRAKAAEKAANENMSSSICVITSSRHKEKTEAKKDSLLIDLPYTLVIFDEVHKAKTGPATDAAPRNGDALEPR